MRCPRCSNDNEWDISQRACSKCGLLVRLPTKFRPRPQGLEESVLPINTPPLVQQAPPSLPVTPMPGEGTLLAPDFAQQNTRTVFAENRAQSPLRPKRLVSGPAKEGVQTPTRDAEHKTGVFAVPRTPTRSASGNAAPLLLPGTFLRNNRYQLRDLQNRQEWQEGVYEAAWTAQDMEHAAAPVMITEFVVPENNSPTVQAMLSTATVILSSVGHHPSIPTLLGAFSDQGRSFFVFEAVAGESLLGRMRRTGRAVPEREVIELCMQLLDVLEVLGQQMPPLVHGLIRPEHIIYRAESQVLLANFSLILAGGATYLIKGMERTRLSPYMSPEFTRGNVDGRSDLYALVATAYHAVTGSIPPGVHSGEAIPSAQRLNPLVSMHFDAVLTKGLRPIATQRYQQPAELRQALLEVRSLTEGNLKSGGRELNIFSPPSSSFMPSLDQLLQTSEEKQIDVVAQMLPNLLSQELGEEEAREKKLLLPSPEELPPLLERNDTMHSLLWFASILVCLFIVVALSRGF